jgi:hydroxyacylglutathione hydrolase
LKPNKQSAFSIKIILCGQDNCVYLLAGNNGQGVVIDPGTAGPVLAALEKQTLNPAGILLTHHHADHTGGMESLKTKCHCRVIGPDWQRIAGLDEVTKDNHVLTLCGLSIRVLAMPGHTRTSVCYVLESTPGQPAAVFTGDTLFIGGCGRLLEGSAPQMYQSLQKLAALPDDTAVYPGHDYTLDNYRFALTVEPDNAIVQKRLSELEEKGSLSAIPSTIGLEKQTNPFLRTQSCSIRNTLEMPDAPDGEIFAELRKRKDCFG